jgi:hypothetical protein
MTLMFDDEFEEAMVKNAFNSGKEYGKLMERLNNLERYWENSFIVTSKTADLEEIDSQIEKMKKTYGESFFEEYNNKRKDIAKLLEGEL